MAYVLSVSEFGDQVHWDKDVSSLSLYVSTDNDDGLDDEDVFDKIEAAARQWNNSIDLDLNVIDSGTGLKDGRNDIVFTNDYTFFTNSGVVAITQVAYREDDGQIIEADILFNDNYFYSLDEEDSIYLGNVVTHELGHFLGLSHSEVNHSSMFYLLYAGQDTIEQDDKSGVFNIYGKDGADYGSITGEIKGGEDSDGTSVFGAHVQAISHSTGIVVASTLSDDDGSFEINGVPGGDTYYLYISPINAVDTMPSYYFNARDNFCTSFESYKGSFYQTCETSDFGHPVGIQIDDDQEVDVGELTIRCSMDIASDFLDDKAYRTDELIIVDESGNAGDALTGYFNDSEIESNDPDTIELDLSAYNVTSTDEFVHIKLIGQTLYSKARLELNVFDISNSLIENVDGLETDSFGINNLNIETKIDLDTDEENNIFTLEITPSEYDHDEDDIADVDNFLDTSAFYFLIVTVVERNSNGSYTTISSKEYDLADNRTCFDGEKTFEVEARVTEKSASTSVIVSRSSSDDNAIGSCGTIDIDNNQGGGGPMSLVLGLMLSMLFFRTKQIQ